MKKAGFLIAGAMLFTAACGAEENAPELNETGGNNGDNNVENNADTNEAADNEDTDENNNEENGAENEEDAYEEGDTLIMGTSADYPPFEYIETGESEEIVGFDIDLANRITEELGYELEVEDMDFGSLIPALDTDRVDFVMAGMRPTEERRENADFSDIYFRSAHSIVTAADSGIEDVDDLEGMTLGVQLGSIQEGQAEELQEDVEGIEVETRDRIPEMIQEIHTNRFDAVILADTVADNYTDDNDDLTSFTLPNEAEEDGNAIAFQLDSQLTEEFNGVLAELEESGELDELILEWFDGDVADAAGAGEDEEETEEDNDAENNEEADEDNNNTNED
ncbi:transporter substrate-binding domain-containing protein [Alkalicoccus chagannorensis]|uniref:transporter substrate-binding domain-containing protein n=1 Tax=Alkalicoccus chagannorensis TaxID=427072 RepID=UPI000421D6BA|nr:transporter substrate-binding domain-containing protein [Alkalicoccus chagannorensis]